MPPPVRPRRRCPCRPRRPRHRRPRRARPRRHRGHPARRAAASCLPRRRPRTVPAVPPLRSVPSCARRAAGRRPAPAGAGRARRAGNPRAARPAAPFRGVARGPGAAGRAAVTRPPLVPAVFPPAPGVPVPRRYRTRPRQTRARRSQSDGGSAWLVNVASRADLSESYGQPRTAIPGVHTAQYVNLGTAAAASGTTCSTCPTHSGPPRDRATSRVGCPVVVSRKAPRRRCRGSAP